MIFFHHTKPLLSEKMRKQLLNMKEKAEKLRLQFQLSCF